MPKTMRHNQHKRPTPMDATLVAMDALDWRLLLSDDELSDETSSASSRESSANDAAARRRERRALNARLRRAHSKSQVETLRQEATALNTWLAALRRARPVSRWHEREIVERRKRQQAEDDNAQLLRALAEVRASAQAVDVFLPPGFVDAGVNLRERMHATLHLTKDPQERAQAYSSMISPAKFGLVYQLVMRETRTLSPLAPTIVVHQVPSRPDELAVTVYARYALPTTSIEKAFLAAGSACVECNVPWPKFDEPAIRSRAKEMPTFDSRYGIFEAQYRSESTGEVVLLEESNLTCWRLGEASGVVVWDFVDTDELHPPTQSLDARRHTTGGLVVQKELCPDGVERVVCSAVCTKTFHFLQHSKPIVASDTLLAVSTIAKDIESCVMSAKKRMLETIDNPPVAISWA